MEPREDSIARLAGLAPAPNSSMLHPIINGLQIRMTLGSCELTESLDVSWIQIRDVSEALDHGLTQKAGFCVPANRADKANNRLGYMLGHKFSTMRNGADFIGWQEFVIWTLLDESRTYQKSQKLWDISTRVQVQSHGSDAESALRQLQSFGLRVYIIYVASVSMPSTQEISGKIALVNIWTTLRLFGGRRSFSRGTFHGRVKGSSDACVIESGVRQKMKNAS